MGIDINTFVGPFVACKNEAADVERTVRCCTNAECHKHKYNIFDKGTKFCVACGSAIDKVTITVEGQKVSCGDMVEEFHDDLWVASGEYGFDDKSIDTWISNKGAGKYYDAKRECYAKVIKPEDIEPQIEAFKEKHSAALAKLIEAYGEENVEIKWGVLGWMS
jgi:hypothetical protein